MEQHPRARTVEAHEPGRHVNRVRSAGEPGSRIHGEGNPPRVEVDPSQDLGVRVAGIDDRHASRHDLAEQLGLGPPFGNQQLGRKAMGCRQSVTTAA